MTTRFPFRPGRRRWLRGSSALALALSPVGSLLAAAGSPRSPGVGYGPLRPVRDRATGLRLLDLPEGFSYVSFGWAREPLRGDWPTPPAHDGMGVVGERDGIVTLVRNHEVVSDAGAFGPREIQYDPVAAGGTTSLTFDTREGRFVAAWASLSGTIQNCAGGITRRGTWLSCEEFVHEPGDGELAPVFSALGRLTREHGYVFEVDPAGARDPRPLVGMGQFRHEAAVMHAPTGVVYLTEDREPRAGFYRYVPNRPNELAAGGRLEMLRAHGRADLREGLKPGDAWDVTWVPIAEPDRGNTPGKRDGLGVLSQGAAEGGSIFTRLEGIFATEDTVWFTATNGGDAGCGQVFAYSPGSQRLRLVFESPGREVLDYPDNIALSPRGGLLLCEDGERTGMLMQGLTADGTLFPFARNTVVLDGTPFGHAGDFRGAEWAGCCFSPDGRWLFANLYSPGLTVAITGPWRDGLI